MKKLNHKFDSMFSPINKDIKLTDFKATNLHQSWNQMLQKGKGHFMHCGGLQSGIAPLQISVKTSQKALN